MPRLLTQIDRSFGVTAAGSNIRRELLAGLTTFLTMAYIIFVQPAMLSGRLFGQETGMDFGAVTAASCLAAAVATLVMGCYARYPIALAPGMGINAFFVLSLLPAAAAAGHDEPWRVGLGVVFVSGVLFLSLTLLGVREQILSAISPSLQHAIAAGIGLFIAFLGFKNGGLVVDHPATLVTMTHSVTSPDVVIFLIGLVIGSVLMARRVPGAILVAMLLTTLLAVALKPWLAARLETTAWESTLLSSALTWQGPWMATPPSLSPTWLQLDLWSVFSWQLVPFVVVFLFIDMFDTLGTLIGVTQRAGFVRDGRLPRAGRALTADAVGSISGACLGTSTVTSYIESATGVAAGGRTGLTAVVVATLFLLTLFFAPLVEFIGSYPPITAPALVLVGALMVQSVREIAWEDMSEAFPAFLIMVGIPLTFSIGDGIALGFLAYALIKLLSGRAHEVRPAMYVLAALLVAYFVLIRSTL